MSSPSAIRAAMASSMAAWPYSLAAPVVSTPLRSLLLVAWRGANLPLHDDHTAGGGLITEENAEASAGPAPELLRRVVALRNEVARLV